MEDQNKPKRPGFGSLQLPAIDAKLKSGERTPQMGPAGEKVLFTVRLTRGLILKLKEANHWVPGFKEQDFVQAAVQAAIDALGDQVKPLPPVLLNELLRRNKKLQG